MLLVFMMKYFEHTFLVKFIQQLLSILIMKGRGIDEANKNFIDSKTTKSAREKI